MPLRVSNSNITGSNITGLPAGFVKGKTDGKLAGGLAATSGGGCRWGKPNGIRTQRSGAPTWQTGPTPMCIGSGPRHARATARHTGKHRGQQSGKTAGWQHNGMAKTAYGRTNQGVPGPRYCGRARWNANMVDLPPALGRRMSGHNASSIYPERADCQVPSHFCLFREIAFQLGLRPFPNRASRFMMGTSLESC